MLKAQLAINYNNINEYIAAPEERMRAKRFVLELVGWAGPQWSSANGPFTMFFFLYHVGVGGMRIGAVNRTQLVHLSIYV